MQLDSSSRVAWSRKVVSQDLARGTSRELAAATPSRHSQKPPFSSAPLWSCSFEHLIISKLVCYVQIQAHHMLQLPCGVLRGPSLTPRPALLICASSCSRQCSGRADGSRQDCGAQPSYLPRRRTLEPRVKASKWKQQDAKISESGVWILVNARRASTGAESLQITSVIFLSSP